MSKNEYKIDVTPSSICYTLEDLKKAVMYGYIEGIRSYAVWKDGRQIVGIHNDTFHEVAQAIYQDTDAFHRNAQGVALSNFLIQQTLEKL